MTTFKKTLTFRRLAAVTWISLFALASPGTTHAQAPDPKNMGEFFAEARKCTPPPSSPSQVLGCVIPEFGGAFRDSTGVLNVFLTDLESAPRAGRIIHYQLEMQKRPDLPVRFVKGQYSFQQMNSIIKQLSPYIAGGGVAAVGINEWVNRITITYVTNEARDRLEDAIRRLAIPREAIVLEKGEYAKVLKLFTRGRFNG